MLAEHLINTIFNEENKKMCLNLNDRRDYSQLLPNAGTINMRKSVTVNLWQVHKNKLYTYLNSSHDTTPFFGESTFPAPVKTPTHRHTYIEFAYVIKGNLHQDLTGEEIIFKEGEICLINQSVIHSDYIGTEDCIILFLCLQNTYLQYLLEKNTGNSFAAFLNQLLIYKKETYKYLHFTPKLIPSQQTPILIKNILEEMQAKEPGCDQIINGNIIRLISCLGKEFHFILQKEDWKRFEETIFNDIESYIRMNHKDVTISELQNQFHYNEDYFNRIIKKFTGLTYHQLRQNIRLENAKHLLETTSLPVDIISKQVGYENIGYFYRIFQTKYLQTPSDYRNYKPAFHKV
jgi:AraC-like DNA-binding protein/mannose-6-phosphate isomerase-like protein (cupin superfamily)